MIPPLPWLKIAMLGGAFIVGVGSGWAMNDRLVTEGVRDDLRAANENLGACRANTLTLEAAVESQNAAVAALESRTEALAEARRLALAEAETARSESRARLAAARAVPVSEDACEAAATFGAQFLFGER